MRHLVGWMVACLVAVGSAGTTAGQTIEVPNSGFEIVSGGKTFPDGWRGEIGGGAKATVQTDETVFHSGRRSIRITNASRRKAATYGAFVSRPISIQPSATYLLEFYAKGKNARVCFVSVSFQDKGDRRLYLAQGDYDWQPFICQFTTPEGCRSISIRFASDSVTDGFWIDDLTLKVSPQQLANLTERRYPRDYSSVFPRAQGNVAEHLVVYDGTDAPNDLELALAALQGLVNRAAPRIYMINRTNPMYYDEIWLKYMQEKGYTGAEERLTDPRALVDRFRKDLAGQIIYDPQLPGSIHAAIMLGSVKNALPVSPELADSFGLPVVMDLRGKWKRNVDAYRYVYEKYWGEMNHFILAWEYPLSEDHYVYDYMVQNKVFCFWMSGYADNEKGADPAAEEAFVNDLFANTPGNVPVMGWPAYGGDLGIPEYTGVRWMSEFAKYVTGTSFCSNLSVHTAIHPNDQIFRKQKFRGKQPEAKLAKDKVYVSVNILDSGDALWYWQLYQRKIWADPIRGTLPIGWCMNVVLYDALPLVAQWYYENATPKDEFLCAISGIGYMNTQIYASRFRKEDQKRIWDEYIRQTDEYCRKMDIDGVEIYTGSTGEITPPTPDLYPRYVQGMKNLKYIFTDLGHHTSIEPDKANYFVGDTAVFHTLTTFQQFTTFGPIRDMNSANRWLLGEIKTNTPTVRPAFMSALASSWQYYPAWLKDLKEKLPEQYVVVGPDQMTNLFRQAMSKKAWEKTTMTDQKKN